MSLLFQALRPARPALLFFTACAAACGNVAVEPGGAGGHAGGTTTSTTNVAEDAGGAGGHAGGTTTSTTSTTAVAIECSGTYAMLRGDVTAAEVCSPTLQIVQCSGKAMIHDVCGCLVIANETNQAAVDEANAAYASCVNVKCCGPGAMPISPPTCGTCPPPPTKGFCDPNTSHCAPGP
jgi:hypothetical protein